MKKKILLWGMIGMFLLSVSGCGKQGVKEQQQENTGSDTVQELENAKGISTIVSIEDAYYYDLFENEEGKICALADNGISGGGKDAPVIAWESSDRGETWEELLYQPEGTEEHSEMLAGVLRDGEEGIEAFTVFGDYTDGGEEKSPQLFRITENDYEELDAGDVFEQTGNLVWNVSFVNDHVISVAAGERCVFYDIVKQEVLKSLSYDAYTVGFLSMPEQFLIYGEEIVYCLDTETLEEEEPEENLKQFVSFVYKENESGGGNVFPPMDIQGDRIICATAEAIYEYRDGETVLALSVPDTVNGGNSFNGMMPVCRGRDNSYYVSAQAAGSTELQRIEADQDTEKEAFTIYSLTQNADMEQVAILFQQQHPELKVDIQVGIEEEASLTRTDVIKQLNTELLAGEGPDVMIMDGLSVDQYVDMGLLLPIELEIPEKQYFLQVLKTYQREDKLYAVPAGFWLYALQSRSGFSAENISPSDVSRWMVSNADAAELDGYEYTYGYNPYSQYTQFLYDIYGNNIVKDGLADREVLEEYMRICAELAEAADSASVEEDSVTSSILPGIIELHYNEKAEISAGMILSIVELAALTTDQDFYENAFSEEEKEKILLSSSEGFPEYNSRVAGGDYQYLERETEDKVFLLTYTEVRNYFADPDGRGNGSNDLRRCYPTEYAKNSPELKIYQDTCGWWICTGYYDGADKCRTMVVSELGSLHTEEKNESMEYAVRPAIWIKL